MKTFSILAALFFAASAHAESFAVPPGLTLDPLFILKNTRDASTQSVNVMQNKAGFPEGMYVNPITWFSENTADNAFWLRDIETPHGVVLLQKDGYDVMKLRGSLNRETLEGRFQLTFLANGITNRYLTCDFLLKKSGENWYGQNAYTGQVVTTVNVVVWSLGIRNLEGLCPPSMAFSE